MKTLPAPFLSLAVDVATKKVDRNALVGSLWLALAVVDFAMASIRARVQHSDYAAQIVLGTIYLIFGVVNFAVFRRNRSVRNTSQSLATER